MWNGPKGGTDYSVCDFTKAPWVAGVAELTHEEVLFVIKALPPIEEQYLPDTNMVIGKYNQLTGYEKAINGETYQVIKQYDPLVHTLGIDANGIIKPVEEVPPGEEVTEGEVKQPLGEV
jgi:hypothetical protein